MPTRTKILLAATVTAALSVAFAAHAEFALTNQSPAANSASICTDTPLRLTFNNAVTLGNAGQLKVIRSSDGKVVDSLNVADGGWTNLFGTKLLRYEPFRIAGNTVTVQLRAHVLDSDRKSVV